LTVSGPGAHPASADDRVHAALEASAGTLIERVGIQYVSLSAEEVVARMPVAGNTQPYGVLHGGATASLVETIGSVGTAIALGPAFLVMGIHLSVNHVRAVREGTVTGTGVPVHVGRSTAVWDVRVEDEDGRLVAVGRLTLAVRRVESEP
jgi:1,4-dihydroxy-2-naphthoyl-CoA hydrolase